MIRRITVDEFHAEIEAQGAKTVEQVRFVCPLCKTPQSATDLIAAGAGRTFDEVEGYLAFSCVGRWTNAGPARKKPDGKPCNYTLGGLFKFHTLEVITTDGKSHPRFEVAPAGNGAAHYG